MLKPDIIINIKPAQAVFSGVTPAGVEWVQLFLLSDILLNIRKETIYVYKWEAEKWGLRVEIVD